MDFRDYANQYKVLCDGAFGTYYAALTGREGLPERANLEQPETVGFIHRQYIESGAKLIRTNTFASNRCMLQCGEEALRENLCAGFRLAADAAAAAPEKVYVGGDIGPIYGETRELREENYRFIARTLVDAGADILIFETFSELDEILPAVREARKMKNPFIIVQFCVNQYGYSASGLSARKLLEDAGKTEEIDAAGFNCGVGPAHLFKVLKDLNTANGKFLTALPNASYPQLIRDRMVFLENEDYFVAQTAKLLELGVDMIGGCCGTAPSYIKKLSAMIDCRKTEKKNTIQEKRKAPGPGNAFYRHVPPGHKLIAVELAPPFHADDEKIMDAANRLRKLDVDVVTFPDSPSGRTRVDSALMAAKVGKETGLCVMPHLCCRDKNAIAMRSMLLGSYINGISNFLVVTGDPVPSLMRQNIKGVFNFDSVGLMKILGDMNRDEFLRQPICYGGALNFNRRNQDVEMERMKKKIREGAEFFFTQPVFSPEDAEKVRSFKKEMGPAKLLVGIMPLVSLKNAVFMQNEMTGIHVPDEVVRRFTENMSREEGEKAGVSIAVEVMKMTMDFADGFYFSLPFNRVSVLEAILQPS